MDPIVYASGDTNFYSFVSNASVTAIDPSGLADPDRRPYFTPFTAFATFVLAPDQIFEQRTWFDRPFYLFSTPEDYALPASRRSEGPIHPDLLGFRNLNHGLRSAPLPGEILTPGPKGLNAAAGIAKSIAKSAKDTLTSIPLKPSSARVGPALQKMLEQNAARRLAEAELSAGKESHFFRRHGAHSTIEDQFERAVTGRTPEGTLLKPSDSGRFLSHRAQLNALQAAQEIYIRTGVQRFAFNAGYEIGEGFTKGGGSLVRTTNVFAVFDKHGFLRTLFPRISELP